MRFVLLLFIRISLICSEDLFWFTCISRDFDTNAATAKANYKKTNTHTRIGSKARVSVSHGAFVLCWAFFSLSFRICVHFPVYNATNAHDEFM